MLVNNCTGASTTNPMGCFSDHCATGSTACCRPTKPTCSWSFTNPALSGSNYSYAIEGQPYCSATTSCAQDANFTVVLYPNWGSTTCPSSTTNYIYLILKRPMTTPGERITLPDTRATLYLGNADSTKSCSAWTGTVTWNSEVPSWSVSLDATCSEAGKSHIRLTGTFNGDF
ncbi:hypothetical protein [Archangium violaceum]|uniref:hypothetical protein n=1 Tax=Archangium violaceum TaxID=83451 RepID=UPI001EF5B66E|nr:hypothetical protein [Archangium violaceum]